MSSDAVGQPPLEGPRLVPGPSVLEQVVANRLCVGCGVCAGYLPTTLRMVTDEYGAYRPELTDPGAEPGWQEASLAVCPFTDHETDEDVLASQHYAAQPGIRYLTGVGYHLGAHVGHVTDEVARASATSGGICTWLLQSLLTEGAVDGAVCVRPGSPPGALFEYGVIDDPVELERCRRSRYYPVELSKVLPRIRQMRRRVAVVGLPCFVKALRLSAAADPVLRECIAYTVSPFCGHTKSRRFASYLTKTCGVRDEEVVALDFRKAVAGRHAWDYDFEVTYSREGREAQGSVRMRDVFGGDWSLQFFMLEACNCCDDVIGETADVSVGDAWVEPFSSDSRGTNLIVCRRQELLDRLQRGSDKGEIRMQQVAPEMVLESQAGAFRHRLSGLSYRLHLDRRSGLWRPRRRVEPSRNSLPLYSRLIQRLRLRISRASHDAYLRCGGAASTRAFVRAMGFWVCLHSIARTLHGWGKSAARRAKGLPPAIGSVFGALRRRVRS